MTLDVAVGTLLGAIVGAASVFSGTLLLFYKDREARREQREVDAEKWQREQLVTRLQACIGATNSGRIFLATGFSWTTH